MSGFSGRIGIEGNTERGKQLLGAAMKFAAKQRESKHLMGLAHSIRTYDMGGGASCTIADMSNMRAIHIVAPFFEEKLIVPPEIEGVDFVATGVYDVISGYAADPTIVTEITYDKKGKPIETDVLKRFVGTNRTNSWYTELHQRRRLAVDENPIFAPAGGADVRWSEHAHIKPTNYTGLMRMVVQLILGIGKIMQPTRDEMMKLGPLPVTGKDVLTGEVKPMISAFAKPTWVPRVNFDYRAAKCHGVTFDADGVAWVIEIAMRGVHAMKLYMDPVSTTKAGRARWIKVNPELEDFITLFSGIPLGITLPNFELFDKYKNAGEVVELISQADMRTFYSKTSMNTEAGWCFSPTGKEAHNTCWYYGLDDIKRGQHYQVSINITNERFEPWTSARSTLAGMVGELYEKNKCRRMKEDIAKQVLSVYETSGAEAGKKAFDEVKVTPTLKGTARMALQRSGMLYHTAKLKGQPQIKFPEPMIGGLLSFDFSDASYPRERRYVKCDTPMYVCYIDGQLDVVSYAFDSRKDPTQTDTWVEDTKQPCQTEGGWQTIIHYPGGTSVLGNFYSNRWDFRRERHSGELLTSTYSSEFIGAKPWWGQDLPLQSTTFTTRTMAYFFVEYTTVWSLPSKNFEVSVAIPEGDRGSYYFGMSEYVKAHTNSGGGYGIQYQAKITEQWELHHHDYAWLGGMHACPPAEYIDGGPTGCRARLRCKMVDENACRDDYEIGGFWADACEPTPPGRWWMAAPDPPGWNKAPEVPADYDYIDAEDPGEANGDIYAIFDMPFGEQILKHERNTAEEGTSLSYWWWTPSPDEETGAVAILKASGSCLGAPIENFMDDFAGDGKSLGGPEYMHTSWYSCYTGVIE